MSPAPPRSVFVVGTRAQLIKVAPVILACERIGHPSLLLFTGQHKETMEDLVAEFGLASPQAHAVPIGERSTMGSLLRWIPSAYAGISRSLRDLRAARTGDHGPNVVVHGDTMSTVLAALAGRRRGLPVVHLESGLTSGKLFDPFPEELSRRIVFRLADVAVCPGAESTAYMQAHSRCRVVDSLENTIVDSVYIATRGAAAPEAAAGSYMVASLHRFQNIFDSKRLRYLVELLAEVSTRYPIYFVLHPATRKRLAAEGLQAKLESAPGLRLTPRLGYGEFLRLASGAACVLTDGGSNQEELAVLGVPTIVMREHTERSDGLGENAIMEPVLGTGLREYCLSGGFEALRRPARRLDDLGPSLRVAHLLDEG